MISRQEILGFARTLQLAADVVEKDYVLGWLLAGIYGHPELKDAWRFKGGTCLKKCYFETYRFSEDLDFTITLPDHIDEQYLRDAFEAVTESVHDQSGIEIPPDTISFEVYENPRGNKNVLGKIGYRGPLQPRGAIPKIKLDLTNDERVVLDPVGQAVHHPYSDMPAGGIQALCYSYEELFAEKLRALTERLRPRDLYDVIHFFRHDDGHCDRELVVRTLGSKCDFKGIAVPTMDDLRNRPEIAELEAEWSNMLKHQLPKLPPFTSFIDELPDVFEWLYGYAPKEKAPVYPVTADVDTTWQPPASVTAWEPQTSLEIIRFAAANHLCVDLVYAGKRRIIEPYSLRRTRDGNIILHAVRHENGRSRSYRMDRIQGADATDIPFAPRYAIELTPQGPLSIPSTARTAASRGFPAGPRYVVECPSCGKRFSRKNYSTQLNPHKDKSGYPCYRRTGYIIETKY